MIVTINGKKYKKITTPWIRGYRPAVRYIEL